MAGYDLIIFDLDGTLVPTEQLALQMTVTLLDEFLGIRMDEAELCERYRGRDIAYRLADWEQRYGKPLPPAFLTEMAERWVAAIENDLAPTPGVVEILRQLGDIPVCIASNSDVESIELVLRSTGLGAHFDRYFSCLQVENPKPEPDVFLLAAREMGVEPGRCLVVEDSALGIRGAKKAGMTVVGFAGNELGTAPELKAEGVEVIEHFADLPRIVFAQ